MSKIWVNKTNSLKDAEKFDNDYYFNMTASKRLETMQLLRAILHKKSQYRLWRYIINNFRNSTHKKFMDTFEVCIKNRSDKSIRRLERTLVILM